VTSFANDLQDQTVREAQRWPIPKAVDRSGDCIRILKRQLLVVQEHLDGGGNVARIALVDRRQDPRGACLSCRRKTLGGRRVDLVVEPRAYRHCHDSGDQRHCRQRDEANALWNEPEPRPLCTL